MMKLFDSHCHLQDPRIINMVPKIIKTTTETGVVHFAVNGMSEKDWLLVKEMSDQYPCIVPNFGLHPWFITERTPNWLKTLKGLLEATPAAAVGEIGLDKGSFGRKIDFTDQVDVCRQQIQLAKELERPASIHCVRAFGDLLELLKSVGPVVEEIMTEVHLRNHRRRTKAMNDRHKKSTTILQTFTMYSPTLRRYLSCQKKNLLR